MCGMEKPGRKEASSRQQGTLLNGAGRVSLVLQISKGD